nr:hypothetical protein [Candidatus Sigynarchaeota archaeon]
RLHAIARLGTRLQFFTLAMLAIIGVTNLMRSMDTERLDVGGRWGIFVSIIAAAFILIFIFSGINAVYRRCIAGRAKIMTTFHRGTRAVPKKQSAANIDEKPEEKKPKEKFVDKKVAKKLYPIAKHPVLSEQQAMQKKGNTFRNNFWNLRWFHEHAQKTKAGLSLSHISTKKFRKKQETGCAERKLHERLRSVQKRLDVAVALIARQDYAGAMSIIDAVLSFEGQNMEALIMAMECFAMIGDVNAMEKCAMILAQLRPDSHVFKMNLGSIYMITRQYTRAIALYEDLAKKKRNPITLYELGRAKAMIHDESGAISAFQGAIRTSRYGDGDWSVRAKSNIALLRSGAPV